MRIFIINGPNLNLLGKREPEVYGHLTFDDYYKSLEAKYPNIDLVYFQSNHEGFLIDKLQEIGFSPVGVVFNPAAYTHTSIALADTVKAIQAPVVEVHISNIYEREEFRHHSYISPHVIQSIVGQGLDGYSMAIELLSEYLKKKKL